MNRCWRYVVLGLLAQSLAACSGGETSPGPASNQAEPAAAPAASPAPAEDRPLVLAFGDSLYAGYQLEPGEGFPAQLERALAARGVPARVANAGVSGDTTASGLQRLAFTLDGLDRRPELAIVGLGGNDVLRGISPDETRRNLAAILAELERRGIPVLVTGMMAPRNMDRDFIARFDTLFAELAEEHDAELYPFFLEGVITRPELLLADGIHPNSEGVDVIVDNISPRVARQLTP